MRSIYFEECYVWNTSAATDRRIILGDFLFYKKSPQEILNPFQLDKISLIKDSYKMLPATPLQSIA
jgi:hypothetical protein